jgi:hypothetical protein
MRTAIGLLIGWLLAALLVLGIEGRLPAFLAWVLPGSLLVLGVDAIVRQQRAPSPTPNHICRSATESPTTSAGRWPRWSRRPNRKPSPRRPTGDRRWLMDADVAQYPATSTADQPGRSGRNERRWVQFSACRRPPGSLATSTVVRWLSARSTCMCSSATPLPARHQRAGVGSRAGILSRPPCREVSRHRSWVGWSPARRRPGSRLLVRWPSDAPDIECPARWSCQGSLA